MCKTLLCSSSFLRFQNLQGVMVKTSRITELATSIAENTELVDAYFESHGLPTPSLDAEAPRKLPIPEDAATIEAARVSVIEATMELRALMMGPAELLRPAVGAAKCSYFLDTCT